LLTGYVLPDNIVSIPLSKEPTISIKETVLSDDAVLLRPYRKSDADELHKAIRDSLTELKPWLPFAHDDYSIKETREWLKTRSRGWKDGREYDFAIIDMMDGSFLGGCGLNNIDKGNMNANLGYWVSTSHSRQGIAAAATVLLAKWGFKEIGLNRIEILIATGNERSLRVAEKVGAHREGVMRRRIVVRDKVHDAVMFSLIPGEL
jgi:ribosomal-protein-serine acetyltransferase